jgi:hypothetical protein
MAHFLVTGRDGTDPEAPARRQAARAAHLDYLEQGRAAGRVLFALATVEGERMTGSTVVYAFDRREDLDRWLLEEPYVTGDVWRSVDIQPCRIAPGFAG